MIVQRDSGESVCLFETISLLTCLSRWLVYSIASYYGLHTWSVTVGEPARREAYVGFYPPGDGKNSHGFDPTSCYQELIKPDEELPKPLWAQV